VGTRIQALGDDLNRHPIDTFAADATRAPVDLRNAALSIIAAAVVIVLLQWMRAVLIPLVLAALLFYALDPFVDAMRRWRVPRAIGAAFMIGVVVSSTGTLAYRSRMRRSVWWSGYRRASGARGRSSAGILVSPVCSTRCRPPPRKSRHLRRNE
jgi:hypothetical protein